MSFIEFLDMKPPARTAPDNAPWTTYTLEASPDGTAWTPFEGPTALAPAVTDPASPPAYSFTSVDAPVGAIYFRVKWTDGVGVDFFTDPLQRPRALPAWTPSLGEVASKILVRTKMANGKLAYTFTDKTPPVTAEAVSVIIAYSVDRVAPIFGGYEITDATKAASARTLTALWAAMQIELNFFAEQIESGQSPYTYLKEQWDDATGEDAAGVGDADDLTGHISPSWKFERRKHLRW
jgi:hypothetical protein